MKIEETIGTDGGLKAPSKKDSKESIQSASELKTYEDRGTQILRELFGDKFKKTRDYSSADGIYEDNRNVIISEIKTRNYKSTAFASDGVMLEQKKLEGLLQYKANVEARNREKGVEKRVLILYVMYFELDGRLLVFDLMNIDFNKVEYKSMVLNRTTANGCSGYGGLTNKKVFLLPYSSSTRNTTLEEVRMKREQTTANSQQPNKQ